MLEFNEKLELCRKIEKAMDGKLVTDCAIVFLDALKEAGASEEYIKWTMFNVANICRAVGVEILRREMSLTIEEIGFTEEDMMMIDFIFQTMTGDN